MRLALSWLTVLPMRGPAEVDRRTAGRAIAVTPVVGMLLGSVVAGLAWLLSRTDLSPLLIGMIVVATLALLTRGMHLDGLADTMDGLGSYGPPERAHAIMRDGSAGPFGVAALIVAMGLQAAAIAELTSARRWLAIAIVVAAGRVAVVIACRRGVPAANTTGFGTLVAGTQPWFAGVTWAVALAALATLDSPVTAPLAVLLALAASTVLTHHCVRRLAGISGDTLGAALEVTVTVSAVALASR